MKNTISPVQKETSSLSNIAALRIFDAPTGEFGWGCDQRWFGTEWQRNAGCGPSVASTILLYLDRRSDSCGLPAMRSNCAERMEEVWCHVTPSTQGIPSTAMFRDALESYAQWRGVPLSCHVCDVPEDVRLRPSYSKLARFIDRSLVSDLPVAFLNLCNGREQNLDRWHWVTIISREGTLVHLIDEGEIRIIDLARWHSTTARGGGFVSFNLG